jgi:hypothetical protein
MLATTLRGCDHDCRRKCFEACTVTDCSFRNGTLLPAELVPLAQGML